MLADPSGHKTQSVYPSPRPVGLQSAFVRPFSSTSLCTGIDGAWRKPPPFSVGPHHLPTLGSVDSLDVGVRGRLGPRFWKLSCEFPDAWAPDLGSEPGWLAWHCCSPVGTAGPRPLGGLGGGRAELADAVGTDSPEGKPRQARQDFWGQDPPCLSPPSTLWGRRTSGVLFASNCQGD